MSGLTTHVLDTSTGKPAAAIPVRLYRGEREVAAAVTDADGRCPALLPLGTLLEAGTYRLVFATAAHFPDGFFPEVSISFVIRDPSLPCHVPLLISPFGFTTYRGS